MPSSENSKNKSKRLTRSRDDQIIAGVCGGIAKYFDIDSTIVRLVFLLIAMAGGSGVLLYIILMLIMPEETKKGKTDREGNLENFAEDIGKRAEKLGQDIKKNAKKQGYRGKNLLGIVIVIFGISMFANQFLPHNWFPWEIFWPSAIILLGLFIIIKK